MIFTSHKEATTDYDGTPIEEWNTEFDCPFVPSSTGLNRECWVIYKGFFGKWKIRECYVVAVVFTNCWLLKMDNGWHYFADEIGKNVFAHDDLNQAIDVCMEKNARRKVSVKRI